MAKNKGKKKWQSRQGNFYERQRNAELQRKRKLEEVEVPSQGRKYVTIPVFTRRNEEGMVERGPDPAGSPVRSGMVYRDMFRSLPVDTFWETMERESIARIDGRFSNEVASRQPSGGIDVNFNGFLCPKCGQDVRYVRYCDPYALVRQEESRVSYASDDSVDANPNRQELL